MSNTTKTAYTSTDEMVKARIAIVASAAKAQTTASAAMIDLGQSIHEHVWLSIECDPALVEIGHTQAAYGSVMKQLKAIAAAELVDIDLARCVRWYCLQASIGIDLSVQSTQVLRRAERLLDFTGTEELYYSPYNAKAHEFAVKHLSKVGKERLTGELIAELLFKLDKARFPDPNAKPEAKEEPKPEAQASATADDASETDTELEPTEWTAELLVQQVRSFAMSCSDADRIALFAGLRGLMKAYVEDASKAPVARKQAPQMQHAVAVA